MPKFVFFVIPSRLLDKVHKLSGRIFTYLESFHENYGKTKKTPATIDYSLLKVICFLPILVAKFVRISLMVPMGKIHSLSGKALNYLQPKDVKESERNGWHPNLYFYLNRIKFQPFGECIDEILLKWYGNYELLFTSKWYIQWLFPNKEVSSNLYASILTDYEAQKIKSNPEMMKRVMTAFKMMLDFWGMELMPNNQFKDSRFCHERWEVLNNNLFLAEYITRILKMFRDLDLQQLNLSWLAYLSNLIFRRKVLCNLESSFIHSWVDILPDNGKKIMLSQCMSQ